MAQYINLTYTVTQFRQTYDEQGATAYLSQGQLAERTLDEVQVALAPQTQPLRNNFLCTVISLTSLQRTGLKTSLQTMELKYFHLHQIFWSERLMLDL
jgi:hypothetical protein